MSRSSVARAHHLGSLYPQPARLRTTRARPDAQVFENCAVRRTVFAGRATRDFDGFRTPGGNQQVPTILPAVWPLRVVRGGSLCVSHEIVRW